MIFIVFITVDMKLLQLRNEYEYCQYNKTQCFVQRGQMGKRKIHGTYHRDKQTFIVKILFGMKWNYLPCSIVRARVFSLSTFP